MTLSAEDKFASFMRAKYEDLCEEHLLTMSDDTIVRVLRTYAPKKTSNGFTLFIVAGWGSVVLGWDDVLLEAMKDFDIVYFETREKASSTLAKKSKNDIDRLSDDIKETIEILKFDPLKLLLFGSSFGSAILADGFRKNKFDSFLNVLVAPAIQIDLPPGLRYLIPVTPHIIMEPVKPLIRWWLKKSKSESPEQAAKYIRVMNEAESKKWKNISMNFLFWKWWDVYADVKHNLLLIASEKDKMHEAEISQKLRELMVNSVYIDLGTNKKTHTKPIVDLVREHLKKKQLESEGK
ncbi:MAG: alpha/beta fold hydrolase [Candidatus Heimdallarchaeaceae archaeon]